MTNSTALALALVIIAAIIGDLWFDTGLLVATGRRLTDLIGHLAFWR